MQSLLLNGTKSNNTSSINGTKIDCAKECPCGVPVIPVPDQWLEVMVTGGFKVWHIIFIMIAFAVTLTVVYCCFHRCRIPRTKQEIEADLMKSNLTNKFRDYLQDLPNEFTTFVEALKKVQELEEKLEKEDALFSRDAGARKRMGWLKLKGKEDKDKDIDKGKTELDEAEPVPVEVENPTHLATADSVQPVPKLEAKDSDVLQVDNVANENLKDNKEKLADDPDLKTSSRQPRRRRHKPNLSRTKRAREKSHSELEIEKTLEESKFESLANQDSKHNTHRVKTESKIESSIPREPKQHTHRVKTEPKIEAPSQQEPKQHTHHEETGPKVIPPKEARVKMKKPKQLRPKTELSPVLDRQETHAKMLLDI